MNNLTAADIKANMTHGVDGEWFINPSGHNHSEIGVELENERYAVICSMNVNLPYAANAEAITTAVNSTYGMGYDPAKMDVCVKAIEMTLNYVAEMKLPQSVYNALTNALKSAKI